MSHGFSVINSNGRRVVDEDSYLFSVQECHRVTLSRATWNAIGDSYYGSIDMYYYHKTPYSGDAPPMVFIRPASTHSGGLFFMADWYHHIRVKYFGGPGNWYCTVVRVIMNLGRGNKHPSWWYTYDPRKNFIICGPGVQPAKGSCGLFVFNKEGKAVFNSNENIFVVRKYSNNWVKVLDKEDMVVIRALLNGNFGSYGKRFHIWQSDLAPSSTDWVLVNPTQEYRRYNGEVGFAWNHRIVKGATLQRGLQTGNSGTPVHAPIIMGSPNLPIYGSANADGSIRWCYT